MLEMNRGGDSSILNTLQKAASELACGQVLKPDSFSLEETILTIDVSFLLPLGISFLFTC
jgi:hypothetical protein